MKIHTIIALVVGVICVFATISSVVGLWTPVKMAYHAAFGVPHNCYYYKPDSNTCEEDKTQTRREMADSLAIFTVAAPVAFFSFRKLLKLKD